MTTSSGVVLQLCWILFYLLTIVECQFGGDGPGPNPNRFSSGAGRGSVGKPFPNGGFGGGFPNRFPQGNRPPSNSQFGGNRQGAPQQIQERPDQDATDGKNDSSDDVDGRSSVESVKQEPTASAAPPSTTAIEPTETPAPTQIAGGNVAAVSPAAQDSPVSLAPAPAPAPAVFTSMAPLFLQPSGVTNAAGEVPTSAAATPLLINAPSSSSANTPYNNFLTSSLPAIPSPTPSATTTITSEMIVVVTPSPVLDPSLSSTISELTTSDFVSSPTPSTTQLLDLAPLPSGTMSTSAKVGTGIGVSFGLISIAGIAGLYLWRRRRNQTYQLEHDARSASLGGLGGFFTLNRKPGKGDQEWSIESAEKVEIVSGASARTLSRSDSHSSIARIDRRDDSRPRGQGVGLQILKVGMKVGPQRDVIIRDGGTSKENGITMDRTEALTSNPPSLPSPSMFPTPPSSRGTTAAGVAREKKMDSWPLPD